MISGTASPSRAARAAGPSTSTMGSRPNLSCRANQPSTAPGTVQESGEVSEMVPSASGLTLSAVSAIIVKHDWDVPELHLESGRLDEVFRSLTQPRGIAVSDAQGAGA